ncbi:MAG: helix-turn-helix transcriptional regulator [Clostridium sp.]
MLKGNIIGENIKTIRVQKGLTQEQLTTKLQVKGLKLDRPTLSKIESRTREILDYEIKTFADALDISVNELFDDK